MPKVSPEHLEARRQQIIEAALECFARQGFHRTTMQDIVRETGLSLGAIYRYFKTKDEIIEAVSDQRHERERALIAAAVKHGGLSAAFTQLGHDFLDSLGDARQRKQRRLGIQIWAEALRNPRMLKLVRRGVDEPRRLLGDLLRAAQERGEIPRGFDPDAAARVIISVFHGFVLQQAWDPRVEVGPYRSVLEELVKALGAGSRSGERRRRA